MTKESTELKNPGIHKCLTHMRACTIQLGVQQEQHREWENGGEITKREIEVPLLAGLLLDTPKPGSLVNWIRVLTLWLRASTGPLPSPKTQIQIHHQHTEVPQAVRTLKDFCENIKDYSA